MRRNEKKKIFSLFCEIDNFIDDKIEESYDNENYNEYLNSLGIPTFRDYVSDNNDVLEMEYDDFFPDDHDWENISDSYEESVRKIVLDLIEESFSKKYIGFYKDNLKNKICDFDNVPILLCDASKIMKQNIIAPYDVFVHFEKV